MSAGPEIGRGFTRTPASFMVCSAIAWKLSGPMPTLARSAVRNLARGLGLPTDLASVGIGPESFQAIAEHTMNDAGVRVNPRPISGPADIVEILEIARG
jgi:alcohol dehydrogenase class IV